MKLLGSYKQVSTSGVDNLNELVFATVIRELKTSWKDSTIADPDLIELLYDAIAAPAKLVNK